MSGSVQCSSGYFLWFSSIGLLLAENRTRFRSTTWSRRRFCDRRPQRPSQALRMTPSTCRASSTSDCLSSDSHVSANRRNYRHSDRFSRLTGACESLNCGCCAGMMIEQLNFDQKSELACFSVRGSWTFECFRSVHKLHLRSECFRDNHGHEYERKQRLHQHGFRERSAPTLPARCTARLDFRVFCEHFLWDFYLAPLPIPMEMCIKVFNIFTPGSNLHMCMDIMAKFQESPILVNFICFVVFSINILLKPRFFTSTAWDSARTSSPSWSPKKMAEYSECKCRQPPETWRWSMILFMRTRTSLRVDNKQKKVS